MPYFARTNSAKVEDPVPLGAWKYNADMSALGTPAEVRVNVWRSIVSAGAARACSKRILHVTNPFFLSAPLLPPHVWRAQRSSLGIEVGVVQDVNAQLRVIVTDIAYKR